MDYVIYTIDVRNDVCRKMDISMNKIILASGSPRRKELIETLKIPFSVIVSDIDENIDENANLVDEIEKLSYKKALAVFKDHKDAVVIGADTIVVHNNEVLGKPKTEENAIKMLNKIQGDWHEVITAVSIISVKQSETFSVVSRVHFYPMDDEEIKLYVNSKEPLDKAGAYAIQGEGSRYIKEIKGDYYSIMGLPISELYHRIKKYL